MPEPFYLDLKDTRGNPLRHKYLRQEGETSGLFFQLPGDNYGADGPLLYFPSRTLFSVGWDTFSLSYGYQSAGEKFSPTYIPEIVEECGSTIEAVLSHHEYSNVVLAGKSLGAAVVAVLLTMELGLEQARAIYLTPPLGTPIFDPVFTETQNPSYLALGTADRFYNEKAFQELHAEKGFEFSLIPEADHSLYVEGDLSATIQAHEHITRAIVEFVLG